MHRRKILRISNDENNVPARIIKKAFCLLFVDTAVISLLACWGGGYYPTYLDHANCKRVCQWHLIKKWWVLTVGANLKSFVKRPSSQRSKAAPPDDLCGTSFNIFPNQCCIIRIPLLVILHVDKRWELQKISKTPKQWFCHRTAMSYPMRPHLHRNRTQ